MEFKELLKLLAPIITIIIGVLIKTSRKVQFTPFKKYWLFFVITGTFMFLFRFYKYLR
jgi:hypothetical protein